MTPIEAYLKQFGSDVTVLNETLQKIDDPLTELKKVTTRLVVVVPAEHNWPANLNPLKNPTHKRVYDAESLAQLLEEAGFTYVLKYLIAGNWSWLTAECVRGNAPEITVMTKMTSKERRKLKRAALQESVLHK